MLRSLVYILALISVGLVCLNPSRGAAQSSASVSDVMSVRVLPGWREADGRHIAGLEVSLRAGWHTYWRSAGSLGIAPKFDWRGSRNVRQVTPVWPRPQVFRAAEGLSYGYANTFVLPLVVESQDRTETIHLSGQIDMGVCDDICIPAQVRLATDLPPQGASDAAIKAALADRPRPLNTKARCTIRPDGDNFLIRAELQVPPQGGDEAVVFELPNSTAWITDARTSRAGGVLSAQAQIIGIRGAIERSSVRITVLGNRQAVELIGCDR